ncbi:CatB-related O-acetyltransferase [Rhizobium sp. BK602]|uniref:CatB-related O-acetyltransferase n=1 Tax=Rhizobium sp. BK602 TaxID=2586986 RepID=UPI00161AF6C4|nr:CatB-related O-acetyltransferase [Rhizobium sp. BK602]MBB3608685.1 hypothetical protein [Rhizobium sp. BK602]
MSTVLDIPKAEKPLLSGSSIVTVERPVHLAHMRCVGRVTVGAYSYGNVDTITYDADIGRFSSIGHRVIIGPIEHPTDWLSSSGFSWGDTVFEPYGGYRAMVSSERFPANSARTSIGNDVWIGAGAIIKRGVTIGNGAIIGAGAVVTKDIPPYAIYAGAPAKIIRPRFNEATIARLQNLQWWNYVLDREALANPRYSKVEDSISVIEDAVAAGKIDRLRPQQATITTNGANQVISL